MMVSDKTGAETAVTQEAERFTISVEGRGRGLATIPVSEALKATRDAGLRIVTVCEMVGGYIEKHKEFSEVVDPLTSDIEDWLRSGG
jgi:predicted GNAT family acetyltransferase